jgi:hypothetical protein
MTVDEMRDWFDILQDKNNAPYFTDPEKDEFIMDANWDYINEYIGDYENPSVMGRDKAAVNALRTLIMDVTETPTAGLIAEADLNGTLSETVVVPLAIVPPDSKAAKFLNHSDIHKAENNIYKKGQEFQPNYTIASEGYQLYPTDVLYTDTVITVLVEPTTIDALPASIHHKIIAKAMTKTGLVTENQAITMMEQPTNG